MLRLFMLLTSLAIAAQSPASDVPLDRLHSFDTTEFVRFESSKLDKSFDVFVRLPASYGERGQTRYPVLFVLDGGMLFPLFSSYYSYLRLSDEVPEMIVVGISYGTNSFEEGNTRGHDFTAPSAEREHYGGAKHFQAFLRTELIPHIESTYRARDDRRMIFGQSLGGQFVLFTAQTDPGLFWGHIASNPALHRNLLSFLELHGDAQSFRDDSRLYVASGANDNPQFREPAMQWIEHWTTIENTPWKLRAETLAGHTHFSIAPASFRQGMKWLFGEPLLNK